MKKLVVLLLPFVVSCASEDRGGSSLEIELNQKDNEKNYEVVVAEKLKIPAGNIIEKSKTIFASVDDEQFCSWFVEGDGEVLVVSDSVGVITQASSSQVSQNSECSEHSPYFEKIYFSIIPQENNSSLFEVSVKTNVRDYQISLDPAVDSISRPIYSFFLEVDQSYPDYDDFGVFQWSLLPNNYSGRVLVVSTWEYSEKTEKAVSIIDFSDVPSYAFSNNDLPINFKIDIYSLQK